MTLEELNQQILQCSRCPLRMEATQPVCGSGEVGARYLILGEAPGKHEDAAGIPFVGLAGKRLDKLIGQAGIDINDCYLTNVCKCRPPANRTPKKSERLSCYPWLAQELAILKPEVIITLGATPLSLFTDQGVRHMHGTMFTAEGGQTIIAQYHPAAALHNPRLWPVMLNDWEVMPEKVDDSFIVVKDTAPLPTSPFMALDVENDVKGHIGAWSVAGRDSDGQLNVKAMYGPDRNWKHDRPVVMHNAKYDLRVLKANGMKLPETTWDTMIAAYCLGLGRQDTKDSGNESADSMVGGLGLKYLARRHLGMEMNTWQQVAALNDAQAMQEYNAKDSVATYLLFEKWKDLLPKHFWDIDTPLLPVCMAMEDRGVLVSPDFLKEYADSLDSQLAKIEFPVLPGHTEPLNPYAPKQIQEYVYGTLGIEPTKFTDTKQPSTDKEVLETIDDPIVKKILEYRELWKERRTYVSGYVSRMDALGRIHPEFKQTRTATGRLSCSNPNLQNVTRDSDLRRLFIAPEGKMLVRLDFDQLELRVFAAIANEQRMLETLALYDKTGDKQYKIHQQTADFIGLSYDDAKTINFLMLFGGGPWKISQEFHVPLDDAKRLIDKYYKSYPGIKKFNEEQVEKARQFRYIDNWFGRRRRLDAMFSEHWKTIKEGEREAINTPIQGTAGEVVKLAMIDLHYNYAAPMILMVHDELIFELDEKYAKDYAVWLKSHIPTLTEINGCKFPVGVGVGKDWLAAKKGEF